MRKTNFEELPQYRYQKTIKALEINRVVGNMVYPVDDKYSPIKVDGNFLQKHPISQPGYIVIYLDGNKSFYLKEVFERDFCLAL